MRATAILLLAALSLPAAENAGVAIPPRVGITGVQRKLTLQQAIEMAIRSNLDAAIERTNVAGAAEAVAGARGAFDPVLHWQPLAGNSNTPTPSLLQGDAGLVSQSSAGQTFSWHVPTAWNGLTFDASFNHERISSPNPYVGLSPVYTSLLSFTVTQPLARGRATDPARTQIVVRRKQRDASEAQLETQAMDIAERVETAFWDLVAARRRVEVDAEAANLARVQLEQDRRRIAAGTLPQVELSAAEAEMEARMDDLYRSSGAVTEVETRLKILLAHDGSDALWEDEIVPEEDAGGAGSTAPPEAIDLRESLAVALERRPELKMVDSNLEANLAIRRQNADAVKPRLDFVAIYSLAGMAGKVKTTPDPITAMAVPLYQRVDALSAAEGLAALPAPASAGGLPAGGFGTALSGMFQGNYQSVQAGVSFDFTVHNRTAEAASAQSGIEDKRLRLVRARAEQAIQADVRNAVQSLATARQRMRAAEAAARAAAEKLASESRLFESGESTNFLVLTRQNEYSSARRREVDAGTAFHQSVGEYRRALGESLSVRGIVVR